ncbi:MAG: BNR repeat-containing protein [Azonexus sp.]
MVLMLDDFMTRRIFRGIAACLLFALGLYSATANAVEASASIRCQPLPVALPVDRVWGGVQVEFDSVETDDFVYTAYYDAERWLAISQINKCSGKVNKVRLPSRFFGWDSHNSIVLALDAAGLLHVSGNMHVSQLIYARMDSKDDLASLGLLRPMLGREEERATYPRFFRFPDGALGFSYRFGSSGDGKEVVNRFENGRWVRWLDQALFAPAGTGRPINAYHTGFVQGKDGFFHVAWVWRASPHVETNFHINYARSRDLKFWQDSSGRNIVLPISTANAEVVDPVPQGSGLFNNIRLGFDAQGRVLISYLKFDAQGYSQLFHARREADGWRKYQSTDWKYRWDPRGVNTIFREIVFSGVEVRGGRLLESVTQPEMGSAILKFSPNTLKLDSVIKNEEWEPVSKFQRPSMPGAVLNRQLVRTADGTVSRNRAISWLTHPADNHDQVRKCTREGLGCNFFSDLFLHSSSGVSHELGK